MIGVVIPAHNEEAAISTCLLAAKEAGRHAALSDRQVRIVVVLDDCSDQTEALAREAGVETVSIKARSVGVARAVGAAHMLRQNATWLAFTDADSRVPPDWLAGQIVHKADAVCGTVCVHDWHLHPPSVRERYEANYVARDGHAHIHGANLGVCARAYQAVGGFMPLSEHEDVMLVQTLMAEGAAVVFSAEPRVSTSARILNRVGGGFGGLMQRLSEHILPSPAGVV